MPNDIPTRQNSVEFIDLVRAARFTYDSAKGFGTAQLALTLSSAVCGPLVAAAISYYATSATPPLPNVAAAAKAWVGLYAVTVLLIDLIFLEPAAKALQETGARIQELFDTRLFDLPWNRVRVGPPPDHGQLASFARKHRAKHPDDKPFVDWYPAVVGAVPIEYARLICQRSSMRWDSALRLYFCRIYVGLLLLICLGGAMYALAAGYDMQGFVLSVVMPLLPAAVQIWREYTKHSNTRIDVNRAFDQLEGLWDQAVKGNVPDEELSLSHQARLLQDELYDRRRRAPAIPDRIYAWTREDYEDQMMQAAAGKVKEVEAKLGGAPKV